MGLHWVAHIVPSVSQPLSFAVKKTPGLRCMSSPATTRLVGLPGIDIGLAKKATGAAPSDTADSSVRIRALLGEWWSGEDSMAPPVPVASKNQMFSHRS